MKAVVLKAYGDVDQLSYEEVISHAPWKRRVLVRIAATSVNPIDWKLRSGAMREFMPMSFRLFLDTILPARSLNLDRGLPHSKSGNG